MPTLKIEITLEAMSHWSFKFTFDIERQHMPFLRTSRVCWSSNDLGRQDLMLISQCEDT